jgi:hypothetical protein
MRRSLRGFLLSVLTVGVATACSTSTPLPAPQTPTLPDRHGAPTVSAPLDVTAVSRDPCQSLLNPGELDRLGFSPTGRQREYLGVRECAWTAAGGQSLSLAMDASRDPLVDAYRGPWRGVFQPTTVAGFPAVRQKTGSGDLNSCVVTTSLGPRQGLTADWFGEGDPQPGNDACEFAEQATALVIRKLPPER